MRLLAFAFALALCGCGSSTSSSQDMAMSTARDMTPGADMFSACGHPGDKGNSKGVGKYCTDTTQCTGQPASLCSTIMQTSLGTTYFCTLPCQGASDTTTCAEDATCVCLTPQACGCVPNSCLAGLPG